VALVSFPDGREVLTEGAVEGAITDTPKGDGGFGYDPVFAPDGAGGRTFGEMTLEQKGSLSHRARAFRELAALLDR
jgi:XTP/dITP diphosphohydrolase